MKETGPNVKRPPATSSLSSDDGETVVLHVKNDLVGVTSLETKSWLKHSYVWNYSCMHHIFDFDFCHWYFYWALYLIFTFYFITLALHERRPFLFPSTDQNLIWKNVQKCSYLVMPDSLMTLDELTNSNVSHKGPFFSFSVCYSREKKLANMPFPKPLAWLRLRGLTSGFLLFLLALLFVLILKAATLTNK